MGFGALLRWERGRVEGELEVGVGEVEEGAEVAEEVVEFVAARAEVQVYVDFAEVGDEGALEVRGAGA